MSDLLLAAFAGASFAFIGIGYRLGQPRGVRPIQAALVIGVAGSLCFGIAAGGFWPEGTPTKVVALGIITGLTQYLTIRFVRLALEMGPLSPLWCAVSVGFVPATVYAWIFLGESAAWYRCAGVAAGVLCVLAGSAQQPAPAPGAGEGGRRRSRGAYGLVLFVIFVINGVSFIAVKELGASRVGRSSNMMREFRDVFMLWEYLTIGVPCLVEVLVGWRERARFVPWLWCGLIAALGSMAGLWAIAECAHIDAAVIFTLSSIAAILTSAVASVAFFGEKVRPALFVMLGLGVLAAVLVNLDKLL